MLLRVLPFLLLTLTSALPARGLETIQGTIRAASTRLPLAGIDLDVYDDSGNPVNIGTAQSDALGRYLVILPGPGLYVVRADPTAAQGVAAQYHAGVSLKSAATPITVGAGQRVLGIDFLLPAGVLLTGSITTGGAPVANVDIDVYASNGEFLSAYPARTDVTGAYQVGALPPGSYFVRADPDLSLGQYLVDAYFGASATLAGATPVPVGSVPVSGIDIALDPGGSVAGTVTDAASGTPVPGLDLDLFDATGSRLPVNATTDLAGRYEIGAVPAGTYLLRVDPTLAQGFARTYFPSAAVLADAAPIPVAVGGPTAGVDVALPAGRAIRGTIRDASSLGALPGIDLDVYDALGRRTRFSGRTDPAGAFVLGPVAPGTYFVRADPDIRLGQYFVTAFFGGASTLAAASPVVVGAVDAAGIDVELMPGGSLSGRVVDAATGLPVAGLDLDVFDALGARVSVDAATDSLGHYEIGAVVPGSYRLRVDPLPGEGHARTYFPGVAHLDDAQPIGVTAGGATPVGDVAVGPGGNLTGSVRAAGSGAPLAGVDLDVFDATGRLTRFDARTDAAGTYAIGALQPGTYFVRADPDPATGLAEQVYLGQIDVAFATPVPVLGGQIAAGVDFSLSVGGSVAGTVRDSLGALLGGIDLDLYEATTNTRLRKTTLTLVDGTYRLDSLSPGSYKLRVDPDPALGLARVYFSGQPNLDLAQPIAVLPGVETATIDFVMPDGGEVAGMVEGPLGTPLGGSLVEAVSRAGVRLGPRIAADAAGGFQLPDLPAGEVLVRALPGAGQQFVPTYFGGTTVAALATAVPVVRGQTTSGVRIAVPEPLPGLGGILGALSVALLRRRSRHR